MIVYQHIFLHQTKTVHYDWLFVSGDDTYLLVDSLRVFLQSTPIQNAHQRGEQLFVGGTWMWNRGLIFNHGGGRTSL